MLTGELSVDLKLLKEVGGCLCGSSLRRWVGVCVVAA